MTTPDTNAIRVAAEELMMLTRISSAPYASCAAMDAASQHMEALCNALEAERAENERLRAALTETADELDAYYQEEYGQDHPVHQQKLRWAKEGNPARAALAQKEDSHD